MQIHIEKDELWVELGPPVPQREVIYAASSSDITSWDSSRDGDCSSLSPFSPSSLRLHVAVSNQWITGASLWSQS